MYVLYIQHPKEIGAHPHIQFYDKIEIGNDPNFTRTLFKVLES